MKKTNQLISIIVIGFIIILSLGYLGLRSKPTELTVYTYESLLTWGKNPNTTLESVFGNFEKENGVKVNIVYFDDARSALLKIIEEKNKPRADVIIGIDNILIFEAKKAGVLEKYKPNNLDEIQPWLISTLDSENFVTPYDYSVIAFVYDTKYISNKTHPKIEKLTFKDLLKTEYSKQLIIEDPTLSSTGISFLLSEITVYEKILKEDWTNWWKTIKKNVRVVPSWGQAINDFWTPELNRHLLVSYGTDSAYNVYFNYSKDMRTVLTHEDGKNLGWLQVEGIGLVKNAPHNDLAVKFIDYFLSTKVQDQISTNNWMYPANKNAKLDVSYSYAVDPTKVDILNNYITPQEIETNYENWLTTWKNIMA
jgi:thiamine transport system substrate-binding protein